MFQKIRLQLTAICCAITAVIVLIIIFICLSFSEKNMHNREQALFLMQINYMITDLQKTPSVTMEWYMKYTVNGKHLLSLSVNDSPSKLFTLNASTEEQNIMDEVKKELVPASEMNVLQDNSTLDSNTLIEYKTDAYHYYVMFDALHMDNGDIEYLYLYNLDELDQQITRQRIAYSCIWLLSVVLLSIFSYIFTGHTLKPVVENHQKQQQFIALASHELRSPLAVFKTGLSILKNKPAPEKAERFQTLMNDEVLRMESLINHLLQLSKSELKRGTAHTESNNIAELLQNIHEKYEPLATQNRRILSLDIESPADYTCRFAPQLIEQAVTILLDNALSYTSANGSISLRLKRQNTKLLIQVIDDGIGISDETKKHVFDRFYQVDSSHNDKEHFGLGLSIASEICFTHKGSIHVSDTPGGGSTFTIMLPLK